MRIAICDDCWEDAIALQEHLIGHQVSLFSGSEELLRDLKDNDLQYDLYLLDIYIEPAINGINLAKKIRVLAQDAGICFISSSNEFYREAYDLQDVNYLLKPVSADAFRSLIDRYNRRHTRDRQQVLSYKWNGHMERIPYKNILYISSSGHALRICCKDGEVRPCSAKLDDIEMLVDASIFLRCHQSFLVNLYQVDHLSGNELILGQHRIPISRRYFPDVKRRYQEILFEEVN